MHHFLRDRVEDIEVVSDPIECPDSLAAEDSLFADAVVEGVSRWSDFGAAICTAAKENVEDGNCEEPGSTLEPVSIRLMYVFLFEEIEGRRSVSSRHR